MDYKSPGVDSDRMRWILLEIRQSQSTLDGAIVTANGLPDSDLSKSAQISRLNSLKREVDTSFKNLDSNVETWANNDVPSLYKTGWFIGASQTGAEFDFSLPHREALDILSYDAYDDVGTRLQQYNSEFDRKIEVQKRLSGLDPAQIAAIQGKSRSAVAQALLTGEADPRKVAKKLADDLWEDGVTIVDAGGNHWEMENYTRMLVRTKSANAYNSGTLNKYAEEDVSRVRVFDGVADDEECAKADGQVWTLKYAMEHVVEHPNCRRAFSAKAGKGRVDERAVEEQIVRVERAASNATQLLGMMEALADYHATGELNLSSKTVVNFTTEFVADKTGLPRPLVGLILNTAFDKAFTTADELVEAVISPALFAAGFIKEIPPRAVLMRSRLPLPAVDELTKTIQRTNTIRYGGSAQNEDVVQLLSTIEQRVRPALDNAGYLNKSAAFYRGLRERDVVKMFKVITGELRGVNVYGEIVDDVVGAVLRGRNLTPAQVAAIRSVGRGSVDHRPLEQLIAGSKDTQKFVEKLRTFYTRGELDLGSTRYSSTLARITADQVTADTGLPILVSDVLVKRAVKVTMAQASAVVESYADPVLFAAGLIQKVSDRGVLLALKRPRSILDEIADTIIKANNAYFGTAQHPRTVQLLKALDDQAVDALRRAGYFDKSAAFYKALEKRDVTRMYTIITRELRKANYFGAQVDGIYKAVLDGSTVVAKKEFAALKEQVNVIRRSINGLSSRLDNAIEEASVVMADLLMKRGQLRQFLEGGAASVTRIDVVDNLMRVVQPKGRLAGYTREQVEGVLSRVNKHIDEVSQQKTGLSVVKEHNFGRASTETAGDVLARTADEVADDGTVVSLNEWRTKSTRQMGISRFNAEERREIAAAIRRSRALRDAPDADVIPFPSPAAIDDTPLRLFAGTGETVPLSTRTKVNGVRTGQLDTVGTKPPDPTGGRRLTFKAVDTTTDAVADTDLLTDAELDDVVAGLKRGFDNESSTSFSTDVLDDFNDLFLRIRADGEDGPLFLEIEQFVRPRPGSDLTTYETFVEMTQRLALFRVEDGKAVVLGTGVSAAVEQEAMQGLLDSLKSFDAEFFRRTMLWSDAIGYSDDPMLLFRHIPDVDAASSYERGAAMVGLWDNITFQIRRAASADEALDLTGPQLSNLSTYLDNVYGAGNVEHIAEVGANGTIFKVVDSKGRVFIVKPMTATHTGGTANASMSHGLSDWLSIKMGDPTQVIHTRVVALEHGVNQHIAISPFFEGVQLDKAIDQFTGPSVARLELFDRIAIEADPNYGNTMVNAAQHRAVSIDTESAFGILYGKGTFDESAGFMGAKQRQVRQEMIERWEEGDDTFALGFRTPANNPYIITPEEELFITPLSSIDVLRGYGADGGRRLPQPDAIHPYRDLPILQIDQDQPLQLMTSNAVMRETGGARNHWEPVIYTTAEESDLIRALARSDDEIRAEIRSVVETQFDGLQVYTKRAFVDEWADDDLVESALDAFADDVMDSLQSRAQKLLNEGMVNTTSGVTKHVDADGTTFVVGEVVDLVQKDTGDLLSGVVLSIYDDAAGKRRVVIANGLGKNKTYAELRTHFNMAKVEDTRLADDFGRGTRVTTLAEEWRSVDVPEGAGTYAEDLARHLDEAPTETVTRLVDEPFVAEVPVYNSDGVFVGYGRENIEIIVYRPGDAGIRFTDGTNETFISWERIVDEGTLETVIQDRLKLVPPSERPRSIRVYFQPLENADSDLSFGFMKMDQREMHLSIQSATQTATEPGAKTGRTAVKVDSALDADEDLIDQLDWFGVRKVAEHEVNHAVDAGREEAQRVALSIDIHKQIIEEFPDAASPAALDDLTRPLIPSTYESPRPGMSATEQLVDFRASLLEDVENSRLVKETQEVIEDAVKNDVAKPWMQKAYNGIREGDPDAHHEFFADWSAAMDTNKSTRKRILDALDDPDKALSILERRALPLPKDWDPNSDEFGRWLAEHLPGPIVPRKRSAVRGYWSKEISGQSLADDIIQQFRRGEGADGIGGTIHLTGYTPDEGIAVARRANEKVLTITLDEGGIPNGEDLGEALTTYIKANRKDWFKSDDWYMGYWVSPEGDLVLDVSRVIETGDVDAAHFGFREGQRSMYDLKKTKENPFGKQIDLTDDSPDFETWLRKNHPEFTEDEVMVHSNKIGANKSKLSDVKVKRTDPVTGKQVTVTEEVIDPVTGKTVTVDKVVPNPKIEEIRDARGRLVPVSLEWIPAPQLKALKQSYAHEYRYTKEVVVEVRNKAGKLVYNEDGTAKLKTVYEPIKKKVTVTQKKMTEHFERVLVRAEAKFNIVPDSLSNSEWLDRRRVTLVNQASDEAADEAVDDLRAAFKILDDNLVARPPDGFDLIVRDPTGIRHISGKGPAPNGISVGRKTYLNTKWKDLDGTMSRSRTETVLHEISHHLDPHGTKGGILRRQGLKPVSKYGALDDHEFFAEAFVAVMTGRADAEMTEAVLELVKKDAGLEYRNKLRFYVKWRDGYLLTAKETGVSVGRIVANASHLSAGMLAEVNQEAGVWMARKVSENHKFTAREARKAREHYQVNIDRRIRKLADPDITPTDIAKNTAALDELVEAKKAMKTGTRLLDLPSDVAGAYALQSLSFDVEDQVLLASGSYSKFSLTGSYGMPQVVRGYSVLSGHTTVSDSLGDSKVRSFYNNILDPKDVYGNGDVTVDFHMADMALWVLGMTNTSHDAPKVYGIGAGLRPLVGDTIRAIYRDTDWAERLGADSPAELQEILWEIWREGKKSKNQWWGDLRTAKRVPIKELKERGWVPQTL